MPFRDCSESCIFLSRTNVYHSITNRETFVPVSRPTFRLPPSVESARVSSDISFGPRYILAREQPTPRSRLAASRESNFNLDFFAFAPTRAPIAGAILIDRFPNVLAPAYTFSILPRRIHTFPFLSFHLYWGRKEGFFSRRAANHDFVNDNDNYNTWFISFPAPILSSYLRGEKVTIDTTSLLLSSNVFKKKGRERMEI